MDGERKMKRAFAAAGVTEEVETDSSYSRKSWRSSAEKIKDWPGPVFRSLSFAQNSQSSGVRSVKYS